MHRVSRRALLAATAAGAGAAAVGLTPGRASAATHGWWHTPGYSAAYSGFSQDEQQILKSTVGRVTLKSTLLEGSVGLQAPVLDDGRVYVADATGITALSESTGERLWRYEFSSVAAAPAQIVIKDEVLVASWYTTWSAPGPSGGNRVVTINAATGAQIAEAPRDSLDGTFTTLVVDNDIVVISAAENRWGYGMLSLRLSDLSVIGGVRWFHLADPVIARGRAMIQRSSPGTEIREIATGRLVWSVNGPRYFALAADPTGEKFYAAWGHSLQIVDAATGAATWLASDVDPRDVTVTPTRLYVSHQQKISAFDPFTHKPVFWSRTFTALPMKPIVAGGVLYATVPGDRMYALDPVTGTTITTPAFTGVTQLPVITNGRIWLTDGTKLTTYGL